MARSAILCFVYCLHPIPFTGLDDSSSCCLCSRAFCPTSGRLSFTSDSSVITVRRFRPPSDCTSKWLRLSCSPFVAHFLRPRFTISFLWSHFGLIIRSYCVTSSTLLIWDITSTMFDACSSLVTIFPRRRIIWELNVKIACSRNARICWTRAHSCLRHPFG